MPWLRDTPPGPAVVVRPSIAVELEWVLAAAYRPESRSDNPALADLYRRRPDLAERVRTFWGSGPRRSGTGCDGHHLELLALAHHGGMLYGDDGDELLARLEALCSEAPVDLPLPSETERDRAEALDRLARLRRSRPLRRRYVALVAEVWAEIRGAWTETLRPAVEAAVAARSRIAESGEGWAEVVGDAEHFDGLLDRLVSGLGPEDELAVVPAFFTHRGLLVALPGVVILGVRTGPPVAAGVAERARGASVARRLKALADPTRLAILATLAEGPRTVTELSQRFALAQPTVSNHVKLLDQSGLVVRRPSGTRREVQIQPAAMEGLLDELRSLVDHPG
jgi:DNA-binding transcriptional ArsR family regulator